MLVKEILKVENTPSQKGVQKGEVFNYEFDFEFSSQEGETENP